jgi:hypothetical protein
VATPERAHAFDEVPSPAAETTVPSLSETDHRILDFERKWTSQLGAKDAAIRAEFGVPAARYYQMLSVLIDSPVALRTDPMLVRRLQRVRDSRTRARAARTFRLDPRLQDPTD